MAGLNLVPNPTIIGVQGALFLVAYVIVKKFYVTPYTALRNRRLAATVGSKDDAVAILKQIEIDQQTVQNRLKAGLEKSRELLNASKLTAQEERKKIVGAAEEESKQTLSQIQTELKTNLAAEKAKIPQVVQQLSDTIFAKLLQ